MAVAVTWVQAHTPCLSLCFGTCGTAFRKREQNSGITVIATTNEANSDKQNASANAEKRNLRTP